MQYPETSRTYSTRKIALPQRVYRLHEEYDLNALAGPEEEDQHPMWETERIELRSVGIDIGSSTSHLMFSRLVLRRLGTQLSSRFVVVTREITWKSDILLTPYVDRYQIDVEELSAFLDQSYRAAGVTPESVDTGAVIITGEASRKENAEAITALFSRQAGRFVCATAGPNVEAVIAAYGSGAVRRTMDDEGPKTLMVVDVGGGTSKIAIVREGTIRETAVTNVGGRLVAMDGAGRIVRIEEAAESIAEDLGIGLELGKRLGLNDKEALADRLAEILLETIEQKPLSPLAERLMVTSPLKYEEEIDAILFSGGVAEYIYGVETRDFGDLGILLGKKIRERVERLTSGILMEMPEERIRATVIGASQYTIQVSGNTICVSNEDCLPLHNLKVVFPQVGETSKGLTSQSVEAAIRQAFVHSDLVEGEERVALAFHWSLDSRYEFLRCLAEGIVLALKKTIEKRMPIVLVFTSDMGNLVGSLLRDEFGIHSDIISVDQVHLRTFDYIDVGQVVDKVGAVPIVVKSLVFGKHAEAVLKAKHGVRHSVH